MEDQQKSPEQAPQQVPLGDTSEPVGPTDHMKAHEIMAATPASSSIHQSSDPIVPKPMHRSKAPFVLVFVVLVAAALAYWYFFRGN